MNENLDWWKFPRSASTQGDRQDPQRSEGTESERPVAVTGPQLLGGGNGGPPPPSNYNFTQDALAVMQKANAIAIALNHTERTMAHVIAGVALRPDAALRFNSCHINNGSTHLTSSTTPLNAELALQACLDFIKTDVKSHNEERIEDLPFSRDACDILAQAEQLAFNRSSELQKIEVNDILEVLTKTELPTRLRRLVFAQSEPSLTELMQVLRSIDFSVEESKREAKNDADRLHARIDAHDAKVDVHRTELRELLLALRAGIDTRLREMSSAVEKVATATAVNSAEIRELRAAHSRLLMVGATSLLATILLIGVVLFRSYLGF
jgi:hypothetical protein